MEDIDKSLPEPEDTTHTEQDTGGNNPGCLNCGTALTDKYCAHCGQKVLPKRQTMGELLSNFIASFWSFESKFFKTVRYLLFKPGHLATEYCEGKRERYYHPARMYVFISFIFFLMLTWFPDLDDQSDVDYSERTSEMNADSTVIDSDHTPMELYDSAQRALSPDAQDNWLQRTLKQREMELIQRYEGRGEVFGKDMAQAFLDNFPKIFFFLLPIFALILKLLYIRRDFFYSEHLVFSIYYYNFFFAAGSLYILADSMPGGSWITTLTGIWIIIYLLFAMKQMYKQRWRKTIIKYFGLAFLFGICSGIALVINLLVTLMFL